MTEKDISLFSQNIAWQLQQQYFAASGINAWSKGEVPHYVTSNPAVARSYAELFFAFLRDLAIQQKKEKVYLLELGAGHGRFCYHFLKHLDSLTANSPFPLPEYCYVLSDFSENLLSYWQQHPRLKPFHDKGKLDHCLLDALDIRDINLRISGKTIHTAGLASPLVVVANYFFDTIPQDLYFIKDQQVHDCHVQTILPENAKDLSAKECIRSLVVKIADTPPLQQPAYEEAFLNHILNRTASLLKQDTYLLLPHVGLKCVEQLSKLSTQGLLLLTGDRGSHRLNELENRGFPEMAVHGSFSYPVNYHAFKLYAENRGGTCFFPTHRHESITHGCVLLLPGADTFKETKLAYQRFINDFGPDDFYTLKQLFVANGSNLSLRELLSCLRLSSYDARFFDQLLPRLTELVSVADDQERWDIFQVIHQIWDMYFPLGEAEDLAFNIGVILFNLKFPKEALSYFLLSEKLYGYGDNRSYNIALCHYYLNDPATALVVSLENHDKAPDHSLNNQLLAHLQTETAP